MSGWLQWIAEAVQASPGLGVGVTFGAVLALAAVAYWLGEARAASRATAGAPEEAPAEE